MGRLLWNIVVNLMFQLVQTFDLDCCVMGLWLTREDSVMVWILLLQCTLIQQFVETMLQCNYYYHLLKKTQQILTMMNLMMLMTTIDRYRNDPYQVVE